MKLKSFQKLNKLLCLLLTVVDEKSYIFTYCASVKQQNKETAIYMKDTPIEATYVSLTEN